MELEAICHKANEIVLEVGSFIRAQAHERDSIVIEEKDVNSLVSYVDKEAETRLVSKLGKLIPDAGLITEEETEDVKGKTYEWIIDPLDGTTNFLYGLPCYSISVALRREGEIVLGIIYEINKNELFYAVENEGAQLNGKSIKVSNRKNLKECFLATGFPYYDFSRMEGYLKSFDYLMRNTRGIRRLGSAAVDLAYVACGRFDGFYEYSLHAWDVAAGIILIKEAGGVVTDFSGGENYLFGEEIVASNEFIAGELLKVLSQSFE